MACAAMMLLGVGFEADSVHLRAAEAQRAGGGVAEEWWSLKPLVRPGVPVGGNAGARIYHPIDSFVVAKLGEKGLRQSAEAGRRTLIRRVCFDLTGLPPKPEEVEAFVADPDPKAYEHLVDRLLASPQYGERWGRHWLDVVHYGETHGYDKDQPRPNAWPYRDYVIRAFNGDKPYDRFLKEQIAGDRFYPGTQDGFEALGFIAAGPWDLIGHAEVPETKLDGKVARHLDRDDMVATTIQTFNSLTVQCAQCHNHKFDPISQEEYYSLQAVFAAVDRADQSFDVDPEMGAKRREWTARSEALAVKKKELDETIARRAGKPLVELNERISAAEKAAKDNPAVGYHSAIEKEQDREKWVMVDLGKAVDLQKITLHAAKDNFNGIGEGFGFPLRFKVEISNDADFKDGVVVVDDRTQKDVPNPKLVPHVIEVSGRSARYIRVTATKLALRQGDYIFALAELAAVGSDGKNVASGASVRSLDSIEAPARWQKTNLTDGWYPGSGGGGGGGRIGIGSAVVEAERDVGGSDFGSGCNAAQGIGGGDRDGECVVEGIAAAAQGLHWGGASRRGGVHGNRREWRKTSDHPGVGAWEYPESGQGSGAWDIEMRVGSVGETGIAARACGRRSAGGLGGMVGLARQSAHVAFDRESGVAVSFWTGLGGDAQ